MPSWRPKPSKDPFDYPRITREWLDLRAQTASGFRVIRLPPRRCTPPRKEDSGTPCGIGEGVETQVVGVSRQLICGLKMARKNYDKLIAHYAVGYSMRETGERFGLSLERVRAVLQRGAPKLIRRPYVGRGLSPAERLASCKRS